MPIQWGLDNDGKVVKDGNSFIFQINEICMKDISVFMAGCIYVYGKLKVIKSQIHLWHTGNIPNNDKLINYFK